LGRGHTRRDGDVVEPSAAEKERDLAKAWRIGGLVKAAEPGEQPGVVEAIKTEQAGGVLGIDLDDRLLVRVDSGLDRRVGQFGPPAAHDADDGKRGNG
jgi:hypothetical protein